MDWGKDGECCLRRLGFLWGGDLAGFKILRRRGGGGGGFLGDDGFWRDLLFKREGRGRGRGLFREVWRGWGTVGLDGLVVGYDAVLVMSDIVGVRN